jgi:hypothetical protein
MQVLRLCHQRLNPLSQGGILGFQFGNATQCVLSGANADKVDLLRSAA